MRRRPCLWFLAHPYPHPLACCLAKGINQETEVKVILGTAFGSTIKLSRFAEKGSFLLAANDFLKRRQVNSSVNCCI